MVFEAFDRKGEFRAIAGGGRYNNLVKLISGGKVDLPALGFGMGDVVLLELLKERGLLPKFDSPMDVFVLIEDEALRPQSLKLIHDLRAAGFAVEYPLTPAKSDKQFKRAQELKVASYRAAGKRRLRPHPQFADAQGNRHRHRRRGESLGVNFSPKLLRRQWPLHNQIVRRYFPRPPTSPPRDSQLPAWHKLFPNACAPYLDWF